MSKYILVISFIVSSILIKAGWTSFDIVDANLWASQTSYLQTGDVRQFDFLAGYGHPGGPILEGTAIIHEVFNYSYYNSLIAFVVLFNALLVAIICTICYQIKKDIYWWLIVLFTLSLDRLYDSLTPPSAVAALLIVLLSILTVYIYKNNIRNNNLIILLWALTGGLAVATRVDIGSITLLAFAILLKRILSWKQMLFAFLGAFVTFCIFDPYMWFMPFQHVKDLIFKITYHYADYTQSYMSFYTILLVSCFAFLSIFLAVATVSLKNKVSQPLPKPFICTMLVLTAGLYFVFLTAHSQATRYFVPLVFMWEVYLPLFIFSLIPFVRFNFIKSGENNNAGQKLIKIIVTCLLIAYPVILVVNSLVIYYT